MQLTGFTDVALRLLMLLAAREDGTATTSSLAGQLDVRYNHAAKVVATLQKLGLVETRRGRSGGLRLAEGAGATSVGALVRTLEGGREVVECEGTRPCPLRTACGLRVALRQAQEAFFATLDPYTIGDVVGAPTRSLLLTLGADHPH